MGVELGCHGYMECNELLAVGCYSEYAELKAEPLEIRLKTVMPVVHLVDLEGGLGSLKLCVSTCICTCMCVCVYVMFTVCSVCVCVCVCVWCVCLCMCVS